MDISIVKRFFWVFLFYTDEFWENFEKVGFSPKPWKTKSWKIFRKGKVLRTKTLEKKITWKNEKLTFFYEELVLVCDQSITLSQKSLF